MRLSNLSWLLAALAGGCAMQMNGKSVGFGGSSASASPSPETTTTGSPESEDSSDPQARGHYKNYPRYPEAPVDPWLSVKDGKPVVVPEDGWQVRASDGSDCTAVHDHCLDARTWFYEDDHSRDGKAIRRSVVLGTFTHDGVEGPGNARNNGAIINEDNPYTAYKTVPATKRLLAKGALVVAMDYPTVTPANGGAPYGDIGWSIGIVDRVDWDLNKIYLVGSEDDSIAIAATRVAVLSYRPGETVQIVGGRSKDEIRVKASEVILPDQPVDVH